MTELSIMPQPNSVTPQGVAGVDGVALTFATFGSLRRLITACCRFSRAHQRMLGCTSSQVRKCFCTRCDLRIQLIATCIHSSASDSVQRYNGVDEGVIPKNVCSVGSKPSKILQKITKG
jgi:hypothetical protein